MHTWYWAPGCASPAMALIGAMAAMASAGMVCSCGAGLGSGGRGAGSGSAWKVGPGRPPAVAHMLSIVLF